VLHVLAEGTIGEASTSTFRDENGNVLLRVDADDSDGDGEKEFEERRYDARGRLAAVIDAAGGARVLDHDLDGHLVAEAVLDPREDPRPRTGREQETCSCPGRPEPRRAGPPLRDESRPLRRDRLLSTVQETYFQDGAGRLLRKIDAAGEWIWTHDAMGRVETERGPDGTLRTFKMDSAGNVLRETVERYTPEPVEGGAPGDPSYDAEGRYREVESILRAYDPLGRLTILVDPAEASGASGTIREATRLLSPMPSGLPSTRKTIPSLLPSWIS